MKKKTLFAAFLFLSLAAVNAQSYFGSKFFEDQNNQPKTDFKVNKTFDENGNLVRYDSVYTYSYSSSNISKAEFDSIVNTFRTNPFFDDFFSVSPFYNHFVEPKTKSGIIPDNFFEQICKEQIKAYQKMLKEMEANSSQNQQKEIQKINYKTTEI